MNRTTITRPDSVHQMSTGHDNSASKAALPVLPKKRPPSSTPSSCMAVATGGYGSSQDEQIPATGLLAGVAASAVAMAARQESSSFHHVFRSRGKGRARLPEKLMEYLNSNVAPDVLWWLPGEEAFALDASRAQEELLDQYFRGTKLSSFIRSLNRW